MKPLRRFLRRLSVSVSGRRDEARLKAEIEEHLALQTEEYIALLASYIPARRAAAVSPMEALRVE